MAALQSMLDLVGSHIWQGRVVGRHGARGDGASRLGIGTRFTSCDACCQPSDVGRTSVAGRRETLERRGHHSAQVSHDARKLLVSGRAAVVLSFAWVVFFFSSTHFTTCHSAPPRKRNTAAKFYLENHSPIEWALCNCTTR